MTSYTIELFIIFYDVNGHTNISVYTNTNVDTNALCLTTDQRKNRHYRRCSFVSLVVCCRYSF